jgi:hypothetical protein
MPGPLNTNPYVGVPIGTLQTMQASFLQAIAAVSCGQAWEMNGTRITRAELPKLEETLFKINQAISAVSSPPIVRAKPFYNRGRGFPDMVDDDFPNG